MFGGSPVSSGTQRAQSAGKRGGSTAGTTACALRRVIAARARACCLTATGFVMAAQAWGRVSGLLKMAPHHEMALITLKQNCAASVRCLLGDTKLSQQSNTESAQGEDQTPCHDKGSNYGQAAERG